MGKHAKYYEIECSFCGSPAGVPCHYFNRQGVRRVAAPHRARVGASGTGPEADDKCFTLKARPSDNPVIIGDTVLHMNEDLQVRIGRVVGFCPDPRLFVRVKTGDGKNRIWARQHLFVCNDVVS